MDGGAQDIQKMRSNAAQRHSGHSATFRGVCIRLQQSLEFRPSWLLAHRPFRPSNPSSIIPESQVMEVGQVCVCASDWSGARSAPAVCKEESCDCNCHGLTFTDHPEGRSESESESGSGSGPGVCLGPETCSENLSRSESLSFLPCAVWLAAISSSASAGCGPSGAAQGGSRPPAHLHLSRTRVCVPGMQQAPRDVQALHPVRVKSDRWLQDVHNTVAPASCARQVLHQYLLLPGAALQ